MKQNRLELRAVPEFNGKNFFIPDYQRGYRWGKRQVEQLIDDLCTYFDPEGKGKFYCLQPLVVRELSENEKERYSLTSATDDNRWYEVIDGQQRLTTIRIILGMLNRSASNVDVFGEGDEAEPIGKFNIRYMSRPRLCDLFESIDDRTKRISELEAAHTDIDSWHILQAVKTIVGKFKDKDDSVHTLKYFSSIFMNYFVGSKESAKSVQLIWYELCSEDDAGNPNESFRRINDKKVSLNNAELVRAMFLSESAEYEPVKAIVDEYPETVVKVVLEHELARRQGHIIEQWDLMERQFRNKDFWAFVKDDALTDGYGSRIEYLFDLITAKGDDRDELHTYLRFEEMVRNHEVEGLWALWMKIEAVYGMLLSWYNDREYYHKIGYLIAELGSQVLIELIADAAKMPKDKFRASLNDRIRRHLYEAESDDIFSYTYDDNYHALCRILFYYNVESTRLNPNQGRFPFELYKTTHWSLEHIHAQNSDRIDRNKREKWKEWLRGNLTALRKLLPRLKDTPHSPERIISQLEECERIIDNKREMTFDKFSSYFDAVSDYFSSMAKAPEVHNITNMALLPPEINSSISNSVFEVKRQKILEMDAQGKYIPYCTKLVFLKYFNREEKDFAVQQTFYWSEADRKHYEADLRRVLAEVL